MPATASTARSKSESTKSGRFTRTAHFLFTQILPPAATAAAMEGAAACVEAAAPAKAAAGASAAHAAKGTTAKAAAPAGRTRPAAAGRSGPARATGAAGAPIIIRRSAPPSAAQAVAQPETEEGAKPAAAKAAPDAVEDRGQGKHHDHHCQKGEEGRLIGCCRGLLLPYFFLRSDRIAARRTARRKNAKPTVTPIAAATAIYTAF